MFEQGENIIRYQATMSLAGSMLQQGLISEEEYRKIDTIIANKYDISLCSIFRNNPQNCLDKKDL